MQSRKPTSEFQIFINAVKDGNLEEVRNRFKMDFLDKMTDDKNRRPIHFACHKGHLEIVKFLCQNNCNIECEDIFNKRPIHFACSYGYLEIVKFLLQKKCIIECETEWKKRPIHFVCQNGHLEIVKLLLQNKCIIECEDDWNKRPIHHACDNGHLEIVKCLFQNKCNIECEDGRKQRPIHYACRWGHLEVVKFLVESRCELNCRNKYDETPIDITSKRGHESCSKVLNQILEPRNDCETPMEIARKWGYKSWKHFLNEILELRNKLTELLKKNQAPTFSKSLYRILSQILKGIDHLDSSQISPLPLMSINIFNERHKSKILNKWKENKGQLNEQDKITLNCFYVSINILSKCCEACERIPLDEMLLLRTFKDFSVSISSNFISQRISEALLYCICNVVDKREIRDKGSWVQTFQTCFLNSKLSTEISLASAYILSYLITEEHIKFKVLEYLTDVLGNPTMRNYKSYCGFRDGEIKKCFETLTSSIRTCGGDQSFIEQLLWYYAVMDEYDAFIKLLESKINQPILFYNGETLLTSLLKAKNIKYCWPIIHYGAGKELVNMANALKRIPLQVAIEADLYDLVFPLIFTCDNLRNEDISGNSPLTQLFEKLSISTDVSTDQKIMTAIKAIIGRGGDIYEKSADGSVIIDFCKRLTLKNEIMAFQNNEGEKKRVDKKICSICHVEKVDCALLCGHTFCMDCGTQLSRCAICNCEVFYPIKLHFN